MKKDNKIIETVDKFPLECSCGCGELHFTQWKDDGVVFLSYVIPAFCAHNYAGFKNVWKIIWNILRGKEYCFYEIIIEDNKKLQEFKKFVADMRDII
jgi:hypothetical protein